ncbi:unnamed protein product [Ophioblennius macclurei]
MEEIYVNVDEVTKSPTPAGLGSGSRRPNKRRHLHAFAALGLLSFLLLIGIGVTITRVVNLSGIKQNLTERLQISDLRISSLTEERNQLNANLTKMSEYISRLEMECPTGWDKFNGSCYFVSATLGTWDEGREDCKQRGADLVVIESSEESKFLSKNKDSWIGLNDREEEGVWKWVNGAPLTFTDWEKNQPDNWNGNKESPTEDCVHIAHTYQWNDLPCIASQKWICEKIG